MSNVLNLTINHLQAKLGSFQLCFEAGKYQWFDGQQIIELADGVSLRFGDLTISVYHNEEVNSYKPSRHIAEPDPVLMRLRELSTTLKQSANPQNSLGFLNKPMLSSPQIVNSQELPLVNNAGQTQELTLLSQQFQPPNSIAEQKSHFQQATKLALKIISSGNILRDLGFI